MQLQNVHGHLNIHALNTTNAQACTIYADNVAIHQEVTVSTVWYTPWPYSIGNAVFAGCGYASGEL